MSIRPLSVTIWVRFHPGQFPFRSNFIWISFHLGFLPMGNLADTAGRTSSSRDPGDSNTFCKCQEDSRVGVGNHISREQSPQYFLVMLETWSTQWLGKPWLSIRRSWTSMFLESLRFLSRERELTKQFFKNWTESNFWTNIITHYHVCQLRPPQLILRGSQRTSAEVRGWDMMENVRVSKASLSQWRHGAQ